MFKTVHTNNQGSILKGEAWFRGEIFWDGWEIFKGGLEISKGGGVGWEVLKRVKKFSGGCTWNWVELSWEIFREG